MKTIRVERDGDYLCYRAALWTQIIGWGYLALLLIDLSGHFGWFLDFEVLATKKVCFVVTWMKSMDKVAPLVTLLFYLRLRLSIDLKNDPVPFLANKDMFRGRKRYEWIENSGAVLGCMLLMMLSAEVWSRGFITMYHLENSVIATFVEQTILACILPIIVAASISLALTLEKAIRFFPQLQGDLERW